MTSNLPTPQAGTEWKTIRTGAGVITGYIEMFNARGKWVTVPDVSRVADADGRIRWTADEKSRA